MPAFARDPYTVFSAPSGAQGRAENRWYCETTALLANRDSRRRSTAVAATGPSARGPANSASTSATVSATLCRPSTTSFRPPYSSTRASISRRSA
ncbi:hypothetical protein [Streptomyces montanus]|uniref:hypothetical protein n=1 Tax=Streptomyces montanus TaxID=2580423 RepID=UPI001BB1B003|nr:hypothetical protein [Streptomyces montanus]